MINEWPFEAIERIYEFPVELIISLKVESYSSNILVMVVVKNEQTYLIK